MRKTCRQARVAWVLQWGKTGGFSMATLSSLQFTGSDISFRLQVKTPDDKLSHGDGSRRIWLAIEAAQSSWDLITSTEWKIQPFPTISTWPSSRDSALKLSSLVSGGKRSSLDEEHWQGRCSATASLQCVLMSFALFCCLFTFLRFLKQLENAASHNSQNIIRVPRSLIGSPQASF